jgi:hypothetical protein
MDASTRWDDGKEPDNIQNIPPQSSPVLHAREKARTEAKLEQKQDQDA